MKPLCTVLFLFLSFTLFGQSAGRTTIVHGKVVSSAKNSTPLPPKGYLRYSIFQPNGGWRISSVRIDEGGEFKRSFNKNTKISLSISYPDFYTSDTAIVNTESTDSINVNFTVHPKEYFYTEQSAGVDISNGNVQIILFDDLIYDWNRALDFSKQFGFKYLLLPKPTDRDFKTNMDDYNSRVETYLDSINDSSWRDKLDEITDSLIHLAADNYGKANKINLNELTFPHNARLSDKMKETIRNQESDFKRIFDRRWTEYIKCSPKFIHDKIDNNPNYRYIFIAEYWMAFNYETMIPELLKRITDNHEVGLINTSDLIIWERIESGDLKFWGHGGVANDDLFTVAGRANHLLERITGEDFGWVSMYSIGKDLKKLQNRWAYWLMNLKEK